MLAKFTAAVTSLTPVATVRTTPTPHSCTARTVPMAEHVPNSSDYRVPVAYHEAAHYVAAHAYGRADEMTSVTIRPQDNPLGKRNTLGLAAEDDALFDREIREDDLEAWIVRLYAGRAAHLRLLPEDEERARRWAGGDDEDADRWIDLYSDYTDETSEEVERRMRAKAHAVVEEHWDLIDALAVELLDYERLDFMHCRAVLACLEGEPEAKSFLDRERGFRRSATSGP